MGAQQQSFQQIPERFLRQIWNHRLFATENLQTTDGERIDILSPGRMNQNSGPDFLDARVRIGGLTFCGNIELHWHISDWKNHGHHRDPSYNAVVLHVVFSNKPGAPLPVTESKRHIPVLVLNKYLTTHYHDLWNKMINIEQGERFQHFPCYGKNGNIDGQVMRSWLQKLAGERMEFKVRRYEGRLKDLIAEDRMHIAEQRSWYEEPPFGLNTEELPSPEPVFTQSEFTQVKPWEQIFFEGIMEALGYTKNRVPMLKLARNIRLAVLMSYTKKLSTEENISRIEALLFHAGGFLSGPVDGFDKASREKVKSLRCIIKLLHPQFYGEIMHPSEWKFFRLRPENFPTLRLAGAARFLARLANGQLLRPFIQSLKDETLPADTVYNSMLGFLTVPAEGFWQTHYRLGLRAISEVKSLIGPSRGDEIIVNAVIPISLLYARIFKEASLRRRTLRLFGECSSCSSNAILTLLELQLTRNKLKLDSALLQQGALQLYKTYCLRDRCSECMVGKMVFGGGR